MHRNEDNPDELLVIGVILDFESAKWESSDSFFNQFKFHKWSEWTEEEVSDNLKINIKKFLKNI